MNSNNSIVMVWRLLFDTELHRTFRNANFAPVLEERKDRIGMYLIVMVCFIMGAVMIAVIIEEIISLSQDFEFSEFVRSIVIISIMTFTVSLFSQVSYAIIKGAYVRSKRKMNE